MRKARRGFTLTEVLVAVVLLTLGVFAVAAAIRVAARLRADGRRTAGAATAAGSRLELLRGAPCASLTDGSATAADGYDLTWQVAAAGPESRQVTIVVSYSNGRARRSASYASVIPCLSQAP